MLSCPKCNVAKSDRTWFEYFLTEEYHIRLHHGLRDIPEKLPKPKIEIINSLRC